MIHITEKRGDLIQFLDSLKENQTPVFGKMTPQQMVEHLCRAISISNGNWIVALTEDPVRAGKLKQIMIYTNRDMQRGLTAPDSGDLMSTLKFSDLDSARKSFIEELQTFDSFYADDAQKTMTHPILGGLNHSEWIILHNKHITHHFKQFELI